MTNRIARLGLFAGALAAVLVATPLTAPVALAEPPAWAPAHGYRAVHHKRYFKRRHHDHGRWHHGKRRWRPYVVERRIYVHRPAYVSRHRHHHYYRSRTSFAVSPTFGGALVGALVGAVGGSQIGKGDGRKVAIVGGAAIGALIGGHIGASMERADRLRAQRALETARTGQTIIWRNQDTGHRYEMTPTRTYRSADSRDCREYTTWVFIGGYEEQVSGTACRMPDGQWQRQAG